jgi:hypothetical protein
MFPAQSQATCWVVSAALRSGVDANVLIEQLKGIRCRMPDVSIIYEFVYILSTRLSPTKKAGKTKHLCLLDLRIAGASYKPLKIRTRP